MLGGRALRSHQGEQDAHRLTVDGIEGDRLGTHQQRRDLATELADGSVRDGHPAPDARRLDGLALGEHFEDALLGYTFIAAREKLGQTSERPGLVVNLTLGIGRDRDAVHTQDIG